MAAREGVRDDAPPTERRARYAGFILFLEGIMPGSFFFWRELSHYYSHSTLSKKTKRKRPRNVRDDAPPEKRVSYYVGFIIFEDCLMITPTPPVSPPYVVHRFPGFPYVSADLLFFWSHRDAFRLCFFFARPRFLPYVRHPFHHMSEILFLDPGMLCVKIDAVLEGVRREPPPPYQRTPLTPLP